jgi:hypothetical protein
VQFISLLLVIFPDALIVAPVIVVKYADCPENEVPYIKLLPVIVVKYAETPVVDEEYKLIPVIELKYAETPVDDEE